MNDTEHIKAHDGPELHWLKQKFFSNDEQRMELKKEDVILTQGILNQRLYYLESGQLSGFFQPDDGDTIRLFTIKPHMLAGIYSFFYQKGLSYATVKADRDSVVYYFDKSQLPVEDSEEYGQFLRHMLPAIVNEIYFRQMRLMQSTVEKHMALKKLYQSEKMATLGQLAAGLAHELNNAIGVLNNKTQWITEKVKAHFSNHLDNSLFKYFNLGLNKGQTLSTSEVRARKKTLVRKVKISEHEAKKMARIDLEEKEINKIARGDHKGYIDELSNYWELGLALRDMGIAADHTHHVVQSIKELGAQDHKLARDFDLSKSISKALALLGSLTKNIDINLNLEERITIYANEGKFIQVWVNLVKNAAEVLIQNKTKEPKISINSTSSGKEYSVFICDNGPGIPSDIIKNIFQPNVTTKVGGMSFGLGLGLSIVERIVIAAGGNITVSSETGSTVFKVSIPKP